MLVELAKWKDNRVYKSLACNQKLILRWFHSSKVVNGNKKTKRLVVRDCQKENNIKSDSATCAKFNAFHAVGDMIHWYEISLFEEADESQIKHGNYW